MKTKLCLGLLFCLSIFISCSDDGASSIWLVYPEESIVFDNEARSVNLAPFSDGLTLVIKGGDGSYKAHVNNINKEVLSADLKGNTLTLRPVEMGSVIVVIDDNSGNKYSLNVSVEYPSATFTVIKLEAIVTGSDISVGDKKKLEDEILASIPIEELGKYKFIYTDKTYQKGNIEIYKNSDARAQDGTFVQVTKQDESVSYLETTITVGQTNYVYEFGANVGLARNDMQVPMRFLEDVTDIYKEKYPAMEKAYAIQVLTRH